jgi:LysM repeat protein
MTMSRSPKQPQKPSLPMIAATTAALPAVVLSSLALAQPAAAQQPARPVPATLAAAMQAQAAQATAAVIPASSVSTTIPAAFKPAQPAAPAEYTIARGDTISGIAGRFGLNTGEILTLNNLQANTIIYPGQKIKLSGSPTGPAAPAAQPAPAAPQSAGAGASYTVKPGDTLGAIAAKHNVSLSDVFAWNNLNMRSVIYPGQKVKVGAGRGCPGSGSGSTCPGPGRHVSHPGQPRRPRAGLRFLLC